MPNATQNKKQLRSQMKTLRTSMNQEWILRTSAMIQHHATNLDRFKEASCIALYLALPFEVNTAQLIETATKHGKQLVVPAETNRTYKWVTYHPKNPLKTGAFNVRQPAEQKTIPPENIDLFFIPGLAFDPQGNRLGHGKGFYDRLLKKTTAHRCGLAFALQIKKQIPHLNHDIPMHSILTENGRL